MATCLWVCGMAEAEKDELDTEEQGDSGRIGPGEPRGQSPMTLSREVDGFEWTEDMVSSFRHELEKLVILDFLIRNTCVLGNLAVQVGAS